MANPIAAYDDGLSKATFLYQSDAGVDWNASIRFCYLDDGIVAGGALPAGTAVTKPKSIKMRHLILTSVDLRNGRALKRTVPCNPSDITRLFPTGQTGFTVVQVDGENWHVTGWHGESFRNTDLPT